MSSQLSEAESERIRLQSLIVQLRKDIAEAEEGEPSMRKPFHAPPLPTFSVWPWPGAVPNPQDGSVPPF